MVAVQLNDKAIKMAQRDWLSLDTSPLDTHQAVMTPPSLAIPGEVLDNCFENLLPALGGMEDRSMFNKNLKDKHDILQARLVCRMFYYFASRWAWRRVVLNLTSPTPTTISKIHDICALFRSHPEVAGYIRILSIELNSRHMCSPQMYQAGQALLAISPLLKNLRVLVVCGTPAQWNSTLGALLSRPLLHTVWLEWIDCSDLPDLNLQPNPHITQLHTDECAHFETLYPILPSIEMFRCTSDLVPFTQLPPWNQLRQVSLRTPRAEPPMEDFRVGFYVTVHPLHTDTQFLTAMEAQPNQCVLCAARTCPLACAGPTGGREYHDIGQFGWPASQEIQPGVFWAQWG